MHIEKVTGVEKRPVVVGGTIHISLEDARGLYEMTTITANEAQRNESYENSRIFLRNVAKRILLLKGDSTSVEELLKSADLGDFEDGKAMVEQSHADDRTYEE